MDTLSTKQKVSGNLRIKSRPCCDTGQNDTVGKIELNPSSVLSSKNANYRNDIQ